MCPVLPVAQVVRGSTTLEYAFKPQFLLAVFVPGRQVLQLLSNPLRCPGIRHNLSNELKRPVRLDPQNAVHNINYAIGCFVDVCDDSIVLSGECRTVTTH